MAKIVKDPEPINVGAERQELTNEYQHRKAQEALKAAKMVEKQHIANGGKYIKNGLRSWVLKDKKG